MIDGYALHKVLDKIERIDIKKINDIWILIDTDDKLAVDITFIKVL